MKILFTALFVALASTLSADEPGEREPVNLQWWIEYYSNEDGKLLVVGDAEIPMEWFLKASPQVKRNIQDWLFTFQWEPYKRVIGTLDENQRFVTWPGAKVFPEGEYPQGMIFYNPKRGDSESQFSVTF